MSVPIVTFFNNKSRTGKTLLTYNLAWMFSELGYKILAVDFDPQSNLSSAFLPDSQLEALWKDGDPNNTVYGCLKPILEGTGAILNPLIEKPDYNLSLIPGNVSLFNCESELSNLWRLCLNRNQRAHQAASSFWRFLQAGAKSVEADVIMLDTGSNLGFINRFAFISSDWIVTPLTPDLTSIQALKTLGPAINSWREAWIDCKSKIPKDSDLEIPLGRTSPLGYIMLQHEDRLDRPVDAYLKWRMVIPQVYHSKVLDNKIEDSISIETDSKCLAILKHYRILYPMAQSARKPVFLLKDADGANGSHQKLVNMAYGNFKKLALSIAGRIGLDIDD